MNGIVWHSFFFYVFALVCCVSSVAMVATQNVVRMAVYLILALSAAAGLFFLAGAEFVGAMQLMIYVGGTLVLLIFGVMLTAQGPFVTMRATSGEWVVTICVASLLLAAVLLPVAFSVEDWQPRATANADASLTPRLEVSSTELGAALVGVRADRARPGVPSEGRGRSGYLLPFELVSVYLLAVLIGAAYLARTKRRQKTSAEAVEV